MSVPARTPPAPAGGRPHVRAARWTLAALVGLLAGVLGLPGPAAASAAAPSRVGTATTHTAAPVRHSAGAVRHVRDVLVGARPAAVVVAGLRAAGASPAALGTVAARAVLVLPAARRGAAGPQDQEHRAQRVGAADRPRGPPAVRSTRTH
ncbi:hypothetical protein [Motilibacter deserti]|uniref:Uncharacterized protein n=1 Tax=Motilibacter deserti TaxID=2714956 RepID=A0ABX0GUP9_9ACTN|nr:hypothetical protein [Motilibacter deserti]NHC14636.1 hypothetical protein [Motilibacter deserti]